MASGSNQAAHSTSAPLRKHDVFLSFYGNDTRKGFSDHLYTALKEKGIFVYRDNEELKRGENISELLKAIQESEYAVVVISKNYAFSKWCLKELTEIVKCKREYHLTILPVFYHVNPSNVRNQKESFADGLATHVKESEEDKVKWRSALKEVGYVAGWHVQDSYESSIVQKICKEIFVGLHRGLSINFKDVVGIEPQVKEMMALLRASGTTNDAQFIGICGMGGIGKTTLAQVIFKSISSEFEAICFIDDVREKLKKYDIVHLQEQIIYKILGKNDIRIWSCFDGIEVIANRMKDKKILLVLDNVGKASQIEELAKSPNWFGQGSIVLLTSRDRQLLTGFVDKIYEVKGLSDNDALRLFCLKAFKKDHFVKSYENLSKKFVDYAQGLPLALKVFGSLLYKKELLIWESILKQLKEESSTEIWDKLKISFDDLSDSQQELFLDIVCFFNGEPVSNAIQYLESVGYHPNSNVEVLQDRSLIKVCDGIFKIHDLLGKMGQQIVREKSSKDPGECSRLWWSKDIIHVLKNNTGTDAVKGIFLRLPLPKPMKLNFDGFSKMKKLKMLVIRPMYFGQYYNTSDTEAFECLNVVHQHDNPSKFGIVEWYGDPSKFMLSNELHVLEWWGYPLECLPPNFEPDNLFELKMPMSSIKYLWNVEKNLEKLKYIDLKDSQNLVEMPNLSGVPNLEKLDVKGTGITQLSPSIILPKKLNILYVGGSFEKSVSLVFHGLPLYLKFLRELDLSFCNLTDEVIPYDFGYLSSLRCLDLTGNKFTRIDCVSKLSNLEKLNLSHCERLKALPPKFSSWLRYIYLDSCPSLTTFSDPRDMLTSTETLVASDICLQGIYFGYNGKQYCTAYLPQPCIKEAHRTDNYATVTWGPTLTSNMPGWFASLPDISGMFQRRFEAEAESYGGLGRDGRASLYCKVVKRWGSYEELASSWGYALFIVYEVLEHDSCQRRGEIHEVDENGNSSSKIFPVFVCELEVHKINDRKLPKDYDYRNSRTVPVKYWRTFEKVPTEYYRTLGKVRIVFRVPEIPSVGRNGVWVFIGSHCFEEAGLKECGDLGLCSISISSLNVEVKGCGGRLVLKHDLSECYKIIKSISPHDLDLEIAQKAFKKEFFEISGPVSPSKKWKAWREPKNCPSLTSFFDPRYILTSSETLEACDISIEAFYFGRNGKRYRTYHLAQFLINNWHPDWCTFNSCPYNRRDFTTVTWGPTLTSDIPPWFTNVPNISGMFQRQFEAESSTRSHQAAEASLYYERVEENNVVNCWGYALFIVYEVPGLNSCQRKGEIHEADEDGNSSSTIFPVFVCTLEVHKINDRKVPKDCHRLFRNISVEKWRTGEIIDRDFYWYWGRFRVENWRTFEKVPKEYIRTLGKVPVVFRVPDIPSAGRNGVWVFINGNCFEEAGLGWCDDLGLCSISISSPNVEVKECGGRLVLKHDHSECYEIIKSISPYNLDAETLKDIFYDRGFTVFGDIIPGEKRKEGKEQKGVEIYEEGEEEEVEICEKGEEEGVKICERVAEDEEGVEISCVSYLQKCFFFSKSWFSKQRGNFYQRR